MRIVRVLLAAVSLVMFGWGAVSVNTDRRVAGTAVQNPSVQGLVLPHHDLARELLIQAGEKLSEFAAPELIVIMSPNHFRPESYTFTSTEILDNWPVQAQLVRELSRSDSSLILDRGLLEVEHGLTTPYVYLAKTFPGVPVVPIAVSPYFTESRLEIMAGRLNQLTPPDTLFVASVDFSHEYMSEPARKYNAESIETLANFDYRRLWEFGDEHMDSPAAMGLLMKLMELRGAKSWETWWDSHGAILLDDPPTQGTSYVIGVFRKGQSGINAGRNRE